LSFIQSLPSWYFSFHPTSTTHEKCLYQIHIERKMINCCSW
jgi:hypothetical protein